MKMFLLIVGAVLLVIMILLWVFDPLLVALSAIFSRRAVCREEGNDRTKGKIRNKEELRVTRKWAGIWIGGVFFLIFLPGLLAHLEIIPDKNLFWFPLLYVFFFSPTVGRYVNEVAAVRKKRNGTEE